METNFGTDAVLETVGKFRLVHLDGANAEVRSTRARQVADGTFFDADCPVCQAQQKAGGDIVFEPDWEEEVPQAAGEWQANARLIAAAPDLLAALRAIVARATRPGGWTDADWAATMPDAVAAIAEADGRP